MKTILSRDSSLWWTFITSVFLSILLASQAHAQDSSLQKICGVEFTDPAMRYEMPDEWKQKPVIYDPSITAADVVATFDQQMYPAWVPIIDAYAKKNNVRIVAGQGTCGLSAGRLMQKSVDIGAFCCAPCFPDRLPGLQFHTAGIAAVALIVHPDNPVDDITIEQARKIFAGEIYRWSDVESSGTKDVPDLLIKPVGRLHCKLRPGHWRSLLANEELFSPSLIEVGAIPDMISQVAIHPGAIGFETLWMIRRYQNKGKVKVLKLNGYNPDNPSQLISGQYPLYRVYSFTTWEGNGVANPQAVKLVNYLLKQAEQLDSKFSFIPSFMLREAGWRFKNSELIGEPVR